MSPPPATPAPAPRATPRRAQVLELLEQARGFRSAQDLFGELRRAGRRVGLATVYRALRTLAQAGEVDVLRTTAGESLYRRCAEPRHHHHLLCRNCGRTEELVDTRVERAIESIGRKFGFQDLTHDVDVFGRCGECSAG